MSVFRVLDAFDAPQGGTILRLKLAEGSAPTVGAFKGASLTARGPNGDEARFQVLGFPLMGGKPSDRRLKADGRIDLHVREEAGSGPSPGRRWEITVG